MDGDQGLSSEPGPAGLRRRLVRAVDQRPRLQLGALLGAPVAWLLVAYVGSLAILLLTALYTTDANFDVLHKISFDNFHELLTQSVYRTITIRTIGVALAVTLIDLTLAVPMAFYMAKVASRRVRTAMAVGVLMPLWASYLVKAYAWRTILDPEGGVLVKSVGHSPGYGLSATVALLAYLWLPYMVLPVYAGLERLPNSLLEASGDLGAKAGRTFGSVILPLLVPAIVAGSIFTFSLSLGDYISVQIVGGTTQLIGTVVKDNFVTNLPLAAAFTVVPMAIMTVYLLVARRTGAFESL